jgi:hypothetical protein
MFCDPVSQFILIHPGFNGLRTSSLTSILQFNYHNLLTIYNFMFWDPFLKLLDSSLLQWLADIKSNCQPISILWFSGRSDRKFSSSDWCNTPIVVFKAYNNKFCIVRNWVPLLVPYNIFFFAYKKKVYPSTLQFNYHNL